MKTIKPFALTLEIMSLKRKAFNMKMMKTYKALDKAMMVCGLEVVKAQEKGAEE